jgi:hypothetical protein
VKRWLVSLLLLAAGVTHAANEPAGTSAGSFLAIGAGTSALSMAGATLASGNDLAAAAWNPASLGRLGGLELSISHAPLPAGATQDWLAAGGRLGGSQARWMVHGLFQQDSGIEGRDAANAPTGSLSVADLAAGGGLAYALGAVTLGVGGDWVHESLAGSNGEGYGLDAGLRVDAGPIGVAVAARHVAGAMSYGGTRYDLPGVLAGGVAWTDVQRGLRIGADFESPMHYYSTVRAGGEWTWRQRVALRAGYRYALEAPAEESLSGASFGCGAGFGAAWLDYAFTPEGNVGAGQHRVGLTFRGRRR